MRQVGGLILRKAVFVNPQKSFVRSTFWTVVKYSGPPTALSHRAVLFSYIKDI